MAAEPPGRPWEDEDEMEEEEMMFGDGMDGFSGMEEVLQEHVHELFDEMVSKRPSPPRASSSARRWPTRACRA